MRIVAFPLGSLRIIRVRMIRKLLRPLAVAAKGVPLKSNLEQTHLERMLRHPAQTKEKARQQDRPGPGHMHPLRRPQAQETGL